MKISAKELRSQVKKVLDTIDRGEDVIVTYRGKQRARIEAIHDTSESDQKVSESPLFGIWSDYDETDDVNRYVDNLRAGRQ
jgi:antitoxin (DNA-binding transcriptional repressor) of toxin-antitoxin stability system